MKLGIALLVVTLPLSLIPIQTAAAGGVTLDGVSDGDSYEGSKTATWYNGHKSDKSVYGDFGDQKGSTTVRWHADANFFYVFVEAPIGAKNMIWENNSTANWGLPLSNTDATTGLTESDAAPYRVQHETHHGAGDLKLDFGGATSSEKLVLVDSNGNSVFEADLAGNADNNYGLVSGGFKDSVDYLLDNGLATQALSLNRDRTMSFEFKFAYDGGAGGTGDNAAFLALFDNGIEMHLSPERGLTTGTPPTPPAVPLPPAAAMGLGLLAGLGLIGRLRKRRTAQL